MARRTIAGLITLALLLGFPSGTPAQTGAPTRVFQRVGVEHRPTADQFLSPANPMELVAAKKADRIAWMAYERGRRNVYTAAAPAWKPVRLTRFLDDNGIDISNVRISGDGATVLFMRGHTPNREGWIANPTSDPNGADRTIWAASTTLGTAWRIAEGTNPELSPDGRFAVFVRDGQIYRVRTSRTPAATAVDRTEKPLVKAWGVNSNARWSPDSTKVAFVSTRTDHSFIGIYDMKSSAVTFMSPSVDFDSSPTWSPDSKRVAFIRRPGTPFGRQAQTGGQGIGNPPGPATAATGGQRGRGGQGRGPSTSSGQAARGGGQGRGGRGGGPSTGSGQAGEANDGQIPGLTTSAFKGGYALSFWVGDAATGQASEFWHNAPNDAQFDSVNAIQWADDRVIFQEEPEEWIRYYSVPISGGGAAPAELTPGNGMVENIGLSADGRYLYYTTNAGDIEHRHTWKVAVSGGAPTQLTSGDTIETYPAPLASGSAVAVLAADARMPQSVGIVPASGGKPKIIFPTLPKDFPIAEHVVPTNVITKAADGLEIHNQLFIPSNLRPGERRPAIIFVHGGPVRQMLLGYHYMHFYHQAYAINQWLVSQGYVVMSVNYRRGIGYGKSFRNAPNSGAQGNAEYQDVLAGGKYLQTRADVDPKRIGIWGLSYGGVLTAQALARNSDLFIAGVDLAGVHLWGGSIDPESVSYKSSAISEIAKWKSPVLLVHGDDDRNVAFSQTTGLVQLLRAHNIEHELIVFPDDVHESLIYKRWMYTLDRMEDFLRRHLAGAPKITTESR